MLREKLRNRKGFTLIEIIVVIVILAVLMAVAVPSVMSYINEGNKAKYEAVARSVLTNSQTEVAKAVADGGITTEAKTVSNTDKVSSDTNAKTVFSKIEGHYAQGEVVITSITLTGTDDQDVSAVTCTIKLDNVSKNASITANKKVEITANKKVEIS